MTAGRGHATLRALAAKVRRRGRSRRLAGVRVRGRLDPALALVLAAGVAMLAALGWTLARVEDARGFFDPPILAEVEDRRILADYRDQSAEIVDMVVHGSEAVLGRVDGAVHVYDIERELFSDERIPGPPSLNGALAGLASSCAEQGDCDVSDPVFALSDAGGLAAREGGDWHILVGDSAWIGRQGRPVEQEEVELWAVSDDGRWLLAWAGAQGLGLFDQERSEWVRTGSGGAAKAVRHMLFAHGVFWLGGPQGVATLDPERAETLAPLEAVQGEVLDMERGADGDVLLLETRSCPESASCLSILEAGARGSVRRLVGEVSVSPELSRTSVEHAASQDGRFVVLGDAGVHVYDPADRNWTVLEKDAVDAYHAGSGGRRLLFAAGATVGVVEGARVVFRRTAPGRVEQILPGPDGAILALMRDGSVLDLAPDAPRVVVAADPGPGDSGEFVQAAFSGRTLVLLGGEELVLHDPVSRRYAVQHDALPATVSGGRLRLLGAPRTLWLVETSGGRVFEGEISGEWPNRSVTFRERQSPGKPLISVWAEGRTLHMVDSGNRPWTLSSGDGPRPAPGVGEPAPSDFQPITATQLGGDLAFSDGEDIAFYSLSDRSWSSRFAGPPGGVKDLVAGPRTLLALAPDGSLFETNGDEWSPLAGGSGGAALSSGEVDDAMASHDRIFLGGRGRVFAYLPQERRMISPFSGGSGAVRLLSTAGSVPVWLSGGKILRGSSLVSQKSERVLSAGQTESGLVYMAEDDGRRYAVSLAGTRACLFNGAAPPGGELVDARLLPDGRVFAATTGGLAIYEPGFRRWVRLDGPSVSRRAHLELVARHLVVIDGGRVRGLPLAGLPSPDSCNAATQRPAWPLDLAARTAVHDGAAGRILLLGQEGAVKVWSGTLDTLLPPSEDAPRAERLRRAYRAGEALLFATDASVWRYDTDRRLWSETRLHGLPETVREIDLDGDRLAASVWDASGRGFGGEATANGITLRPLVRPVLPRPRQPPSGILDIAAIGQRTAILGLRRLELFDPDEPNPFSALDLPPAAARWSLARVPGAAELVLVDGQIAAPERIFVVDIPEARRRGRADLADVSWAYHPWNDRNWMLGSDQLWRIDDALALYACPLAVGRSAAETCAREAASPARLAPADVKAAVPDGEGGTLMQLAGRIARFDPANRFDRDIHGPEVTGGGRLFRLNRDILFWEGHGGGLYRYEPEQNFVEILQSVLDLRRRGVGLGATTPSGLMLLEPGGGDARAPGGEERRLRAATMTDAGDVFGLDEDGWVRGVGDPAYAPEELDFPAGPVAVAPGPAAGAPGAPAADVWWSQASDGAIRADWRVDCEPAAPAPAPAPVEEPGAEETAPPERQGRDGPSPAEAAPPKAPPAPGAEAPPAISSVCRETWQAGLRLADGERLLTVSREGEGLIVSTTEADYRIDRETGAVSRVGDWVDGLEESRRDAEELYRLRNRFVTIAGEPRFAPPALQELGDGQFRVDRGGGPRQTAYGGATATAEPFDRGWIRWERSDGTVRFGPDTRLAATQAIHDGRFLPDAPGRSAFLGGDRFAYLNAHGLWHARIGRSMEPVRLAPMETPVGLAHGRFLFASGGLDARTGARAADTGRHIARVGPLEVTERLRGGGVSATYRVSGQDLPAFGRNGFRMDERLGVTSRGGEVQVLTPLGLLSAERFVKGLAAPAGTSRVETEGGEPLALTARGWRKFDGASWLSVDPPRANRVLAEESGRRWRRKDGEIDIVPLAAGEDWRASRRGLAFEADRLEALAADRDGPVIVTGVGTFSARDLAGLAALSAPDAPDPGAVALDALPATPTRSVLWAEAGSRRWIWDRGSRVWRRPAARERPWAERLAVDLSDIRILFRNGSAQAGIRIEDLDGTRRFVPFGWRAGEEMPFDRVRSAAAEGGDILLATDLGLRRLGLDGGRVSGSELFSGARPGGDPLAFERVGRPDSAPARLLAEAGRSCFELPSPNAAPARCADLADDLSRRFVARTDLWRWRKGDRVLEGAYLDASGASLLPVRIRGGRHLPHDALRASATCGGDAAELWAGADIVAQTFGGRPARLDRLPGVERFLCQRDAAPLGRGRTLDAGFYTTGREGAWRLDGGRWGSAVSGAAIAKRARGDVPWEARRLRAVLEEGRLSVEHRWRDDIWRRLPWRGDRPALDTVIGLSSLAGGFQVLSPSGVYSWDGGIDPDRFALRTPPDRSGFADCDPALIEARDGSVQAAPVESGDQLAVFCSDGEAWLGTPVGGREAGAFGPLRKDPYADRPLVRTPIWTWTRRAESGGARSLEITFKNEQIALAGGRLSLDDYAGVAMPTSEHIEVLTQAAGWWRSPAGDLSAGSAFRAPPEARPEKATALRTDFVDGEPRLCVEAGSNILMDGDGSVARAPFCRDWRGRDRIWTWYSGPGEVSAQGIALNKVPMQRRLGDGRFDDLFVTAAPMIDRADPDRRVYAPTRAGVVVLGDEGPEGVYESGASGFLTADTWGDPVLLTRSGPVELRGKFEPDCPALGDLAARLPEASEVFRVDPVSPQAVQVTLREGGVARQLLAPCEKLEGALAWASPATVQGRARYRALGAASVGGRLIASLDAPILTLADSDGNGTVLPMPVLGAPVSLAAAPDSRAILVATARKLYRLDVDRALTEIALEGRPVDAPSGPFAPPAPPPPVPAGAEAETPPAADVPTPAPASDPRSTSTAAPPEPERSATDGVRGLQPLGSADPVPLTAAQRLAVQRVLRDQGLYAGGIDGIIGPLSRQAIRAWQSSRGFESTGELTELQLRQLLESR